MADLAQAQTLSELIEARGDQMAVVRDTPWLAHLADIPENATAPLAMSGPHPRAVGSYGAEARDWIKAEFGTTLRWWQELAITRQLEHDADGALVWREIVETGPRRIGKSTRLRGTATWRCAHAERFHETQLAMLVSKDLAVGKEIHRGSWRWAEKKGWSVYRLGGAQEIGSPAEDRWLLRAPNAAYGYDVGYGQVDESWGVDPQAITDGLEPALLERESPQLHLTSTAHVKASSLMRRRLGAALRDADPDILLLFWGAHPDADIADEATWRASSPHWSADRLALMRRKYGAAMAGQNEPEFDDPDPVRGWAAQYLNVWPLLLGPDASGIFPGWSNLATDRQPPPPAALGIAADLDQAWLSLGAASGDEKPYLGIPTSAKTGQTLRLRSADHAAFVGEVARIQRATGCNVVIDQRGPASFLIPALQEASVTLVLANLDDLVQASADIVNAVAVAGVEHGDMAELNTAVDSAGWRMVGDRRALGRKNGDISALEAVALAMWGAGAQVGPAPLTGSLMA